MKEETSNEQFLEDCREVLRIPYAGLGGALLQRLIELAETQSARLAQLESVLAEAGEALEPFAREGRSLRAHEDGDTYIETAILTAGDLRRAASVSNQIAALKEKSE